MTPKRNAPTFFANAAAFRAWLDAHHDTASDVLVGLYKKGAKSGTMTYQDALDEALCYGWIDGVRKSLDERRYTIRFSPRKPGSRWSAVNTRRAAELTAHGRMAPAGAKAFAARDPDKPGYSYEQRVVELDPAYRGKLEAHPRAWAHFESRPAWYRRTAAWWVMSAKREETRERRLALLVACCEQGLTLPQFIPRPGGNKRRRAKR